MSKKTAGTRAQSSLGDEIVGRINQLGTISETPEHLARVFLSPEHRIAADLILSWMVEAGMTAHLDAIGNVCGRYEGERPGLPCLMLGSHYDTVRDAGKWDGPLGVDHRDLLRRRPAQARQASAVRDRGRRLCRRGGRALCLDLARQPRGGGNVRGERARRQRPRRHHHARCDDRVRARPRSYRCCGARPGELLAYVELHIEQGPVLEANTCRSASSPRLPARHGSPPISPAWPATPAPCRWRCAATR